jgi:hypothetical protein
VAEGDVVTDAPLILWGRCRSGQRWFWAARDFDGPREHGWADTQERAVNAAGEAVERLAGGRVVTVLVRHGIASQALRDVNAAKRRARPADGTATDVVEYLYGVMHGHEGNDFTESVVTFRVTKRTARRVYYIRREGRGDDPQIGFVDRQQLEEIGEVLNRSAGWWAPDFRLYAAPPDLEPRQPDVPDLAQLKAAMAAAHPDRGGTDAEFIAARERYERART